MEEKREREREKNLVALQPRPGADAADAAAPTKKLKLSQVASKEFFLKMVPLFDGGDDVGMVLSPQCFHNLNPHADIFNHSNVHFWECVSFFFFFFFFFFLFFLGFFPSRFFQFFLSKPSALTPPL